MEAVGPRLGPIGVPWPWAVPGRRHKPSARNQRPTSNPFCHRFKCRAASTERRRDVCWPKFCMRTALFASVSNLRHWPTETAAWPCQQSHDTRDSFPNSDGPVCSSRVGVSSNSAKRGARYLFSSTHLIKTTSPAAFSVTLSLSALWRWDTDTHRSLGRKGGAGHISACQALNMGRGRG